MNILFVCNQGMHRSRTAAEMFAGEFGTDFAGIYSNIVTAEQLDAADLVIVMEDHQRQFISERFPNHYLKKRIVSADIPDAYSYGQQELRDLLEQRVRPLVELR